MANEKWLVMVYLGANKSLSVDFLWDLKEMQEIGAVGPGKDVQVVAQYDPGQGIPTQRYIINDSGFKNGADGLLVLDNVPIVDLGPEDSSLVSDLKKTLGDLANALRERTKQAVLDPLNTVKLDPQNEDSGNPLTLLRFILWGINRVPQADHYVVILSGHGSGADGDFLPDPTFKDSLTLPGLREVFKLVQTRLRGLGRKLDILGLDSCLMSMVEVYYELAGNVKYVVGAEGFEPTSGWPYQRILGSLTKKSDMTSEQFVKQIVDDYVLYYFDYALAGLSVDLSACEVKDGEAGNPLLYKIGALAKKLNEKLKDRVARSSIISARQKAQSYKFDQYVDLWHFCDVLPQEEECEDLLPLCKIVQDEIDEIVLNTSYVGPESQDSHGLSVYFPWYEVSEPYKDLEFSKRTGDLAKGLELTKRKEQLAKDLALTTEQLAKEQLAKEQLANDLKLTTEQLANDLKLTTEELAKDPDVTKHIDQLANDLKLAKDKLAEITPWNDFLEEFTKAFRALELVDPDEVTVEESNVRYAGKTLYSNRTLHSGTTALHSGTTQGPENSLSVGYGKPPSLVWKPPKGAIEDHVRALSSFSPTKHYEEMAKHESQDAKRLFKKLARQIRGKLHPKYEELNLDQRTQLDNTMTTHAKEIGALKALTGGKIDEQTIAEYLLAHTRFKAFTRNIRRELRERYSNYEELNPDQREQALDKVMTPHAAEISELQAFTQSKIDAKVLEKFLVARKNLTKFLGVET